MDAFGIAEGIFYFDAKSSRGTRPKWVSIRIEHEIGEDKKSYQDAKKQQSTQRALPDADSDGWRS